jgi:hypothetical protein
MTRLSRKLGKAGFALALLAFAAGAFAQGFERRATPLDRSGVPEWKPDPEVPNDLFTFLRIHYHSNGRRRGWGGWGGGDRAWLTDVPDADLNLAFRLHEMTSLQVYPDLKFLELTDPELNDFPFIYMVEPGALGFRDEEVPILRKYLLGGGFLMLDDFWGVAEGQNVIDELKRVFPERDLVELSLDHPIFHTVFNFKTKPQVPGIGAWSRSGLSYERPDAKEVDYRALYDDKGRMMVVFCHNTDNGDGWEREAEDAEYFKLFSEPMAYPWMINVLFYAMTH